MAHVTEAYKKRSITKITKSTKVVRERNLIFLQGRIIILNHYVKYLPVVLFSN